MSDLKQTKIIRKINRETKEGSIVWEVNGSKPSSLSGSEYLVDNVYTSKVHDKWVRLYKFQKKYYYVESDYEWTDEYRLEFIDLWGKSEWAFPDDAAIPDLYETVRYKTSKIETFMDEYLDKEEKKEEEHGDDVSDLPF